MPMGTREKDLRDALLDIEWASRRRPNAETLERINAIARAALGSTAWELDAALSPRRSHRFVDAVPGQLRIP